MMKLVDDHDVEVARVQRLEPVCRQALNGRKHVLEVARSANGDQARQSRGLREAQTSLEARLSGLVGAEVADDIVRGYTQQAMALSRRLTNE